MPETVELKYRAFLSYAHADAGWAKWLHGRLEAFRIDNELIGKPSPLGPIPKTLRPIFRDRDEFSGGHTLGDATVAAIDASAALIVICSPVAATRPAVNEEVRLFRWRHPNRPVIPVIVDGTTPDNFPAALCYEISVDGTVTDKSVTILGPDMRETADGRSLGLAKVIAGLTGLGTDDIVRRAERQRRYAARLRNGIIAALSILLIAATGSAIAAWQNAASREAMLIESIGITNSVVQQVVKLRDYVPGAVIESLLTQADQGFTRLLNRDAANLLLREKYGIMLLEFSRHYGSLGLAAKQKDSAQRAQSEFAYLSGAPSAPTRHRHFLAASWMELGNADMSLGQLASASDHFAKAQNIFLEGLVVKRGKDPLLVPSEQLGRNRIVISGSGSNIGATRGVGPSVVPSLDGLSDDLNRRWSAAKVSIRNGDVAFEQGHFDKALSLFNEALTNIASLRETNDSKLTPIASDGMLYDVGIAHIRIGDVFRESEKPAPAISAYIEAMKIYSNLRDRRADNRHYERMYAVTFARRGLAWRLAGEYKKSVTDLEVAIGTYDALLRIDQSNSGWKRDLQVTHGNLGETLLSAGEIDNSKKVLLRAEVLANELVRIDPANNVWKNDRAVASILVGLAELRLGAINEARTRFRSAAVELQNLVNLDPSNEIWKLELESLKALQATVSERPAF